MSLEGVITGRVDSLEPGVQLTLKVASAIGRAFRMETLRAVHPMGLSRDVISDHLSELARHDLVLAESAGDDPEFLFKHVVLRDVVYALMTIEQRRGLHRAIARRLELQHADDLTPVVGLLAHHWRHTGEAGTAVGYLERAGEQAFNAAASEETIHLVSDAVGLTREHALPIEAARLARWYWWRGFAHVRSGHFLDANADLRERLSLLGQRIPSTKAGVVSGLITGLVRQASRLIVGTRAATGPARDEARLAASLYHRYMEVQWNLQAPLWSLEAVVQCLNVSDSAGESPEIGISYANAGFWAGQLGLTRLAEFLRTRPLHGGRQRAGRRRGVLPSVARRLRVVDRIVGCRRACDAGRAHRQPPRRDKAGRGRPDRGRKRRPPARPLRRRHRLAAPRRGVAVAVPARQHSACGVSPDCCSLIAGSDGRPARS